MVETKKIWFGRIYKKRKKEIVPVDENFRAFYTDNIKRQMIGVIDGVGYDFDFPYSTRYFVDVDELTHISYAFPKVEFPEEIDENQVRLMEQIYNVLYAERNKRKELEKAIKVLSIGIQKED